MRKIEIARRITDETGVTQLKAEEVVNTIFNEIKNALQHGDSVILRGFGRFNVRDKPARPGRNPKTLEEAPIAPRRVVQFKPGIQFKAAVNAPTPSKTAE